MVAVAPNPRRFYRVLAPRLRILEREEEVAADSDPLARIGGVIDKAYRAAQSRPLHPWKVLGRG